MSHSLFTPVVFLQYLLCPADLDLSTDIKVLWLQKKVSVGGKNYTRNL